MAGIGHRVSLPPAARVAGTGRSGVIGDDGPAADARLRGPAGVAVCADGGFLVADFAGHTVRRVSADGVITRVAGTGIPGGDALYHPNWVAVTAAGFLIADFGNRMVREVTPP